MAESLLTRRDHLALVALLDAKIQSIPVAKTTERGLWEDVRRRLKGDLSARPKSMANALAALLNSARAGQIEEVDRVAKGIEQALLEHGDIEGSRIFGKVVATKYERPRPPAPPGPRQGGGGSGGGGGDVERVMRRLPDLGLDDAGGAIRWFPPRDMGDEYVKDAHVGPTIERLVAELRLSQVFLDAGIDAPTRVLFTGPQGTGKTMTAQYIGGCLGLPVAVAKITKIVGKYLGDTGSKLTKVIEAGVKGRGILFLDEIDGLCQSRASGGDSGADQEMQRVTTGLLQDLNDLPLSQIVIAATNVPDALDSALRSRLAFEIEFRNPDPDARRLMTTKHWAKVAHEAAAIDAFVKGTDGKSGRFIRAAAMGAARAAMLEAATLGTALASLEGKVDLATVNQAKITTDHVKTALEHAKKAGDA